MTHTCHAHGCSKPVSTALFVCRNHWRALRIDLRRAIMREYVEGQELTKTPTLRYLAVQRLAVSALAFKPHDEEAAKVSAGYLAEAITYQQRAIAAGQGDPLEGLVPIRRVA